MATKHDFTITYMPSGNSPVGDAMRQVEAVSISLNNVSQNAIRDLPQETLARSAFHIPAGLGASYLIHPTGNALSLIKCRTGDVGDALKSTKGLTLPLEAPDFANIGALLLNDRAAGNRLAEQVEEHKFLLENQQEDIGVGRSLSGFVTGNSVPTAPRTAPILDMGRFHPAQGRQLGL